MPHWLGASLSHAFALSLLPSDAGRTRVRHIELQIGTTLPPFHAAVTRATGVGQHNIASVGQVGGPVDKGNTALLLLLEHNHEAQEPWIHGKLKFYHALPDR